MTQLVFCLGEGDVKRVFARFSSFKKELQRDGRLSSARLSLQKEDVPARKAALQNVVQAGNAGHRLIAQKSHRCNPVYVQGRVLQGFCDQGRQSRRDKQAS